MLLLFSLHVSQYRHVKHGYFTVVTESHRDGSLVTKPASSTWFTMYHSEVLFLILDSKSAFLCISYVVHAYAINMES